MPIRIRHRDKNTATVQQVNIAGVITEVKSFSQAFQMALERYLGYYADPYKHCSAYMYWIKPESVGTGRRGRASTRLQPIFRPGQ